MLIKILKDIVNTGQDTEARTDSPFPDAGPRSVVLVSHGLSRSDPFKEIARLMKAMYAQIGLHCHVVDMFPASWPNRGVEALFRNDQVRYGVGWGGIGSGMRLTAGNSHRHAWPAGGLPFFKMMGDHPAYFLDLNDSPSANMVSLYAYAEHCEFFTRHMQPQGYGGVTPVIQLQPLPPEALDFGAKQSGPVVFLKNGNDPAALRRDWKARLPASVSAALLEMSDELVAGAATERAWRIDALVARYFADRGLAIAAKLKFLAFYIVQLDDYLRRYKSTMIAESLLDFPVEVHGEGWEHIDFIGKKARLVPFGNYARSTELIREALCVLDMAPNTHSAPHERFIRCASRHTLCLTNHLDVLERRYGACGQPLFEFTPESIRERVAAVLDQPRRHVEIGRAVGAEFARHTSPTALVDCLEMLAGQLQAVEGDEPGVQPFFVWPPKNFS